MLAQAQHRRRRWRGGPHPGHSVLDLDVPPRQTSLPSLPHVAMPTCSRPSSQKQEAISALAMGPPRGNDHAACPPTRSSLPSPPLRLLPQPLLSSHSVHEGLDRTGFPTTQRCQFLRTASVR